MTLTIELSPEQEKALEAAAANEGMPVSQFAGNFLSEALQDFLQDLEDAEELRERMSNRDTSDCYTLDDLRKAIRGPKANGTA